MSFRGSLFREPSGALHGFRNHQCGTVGKEASTFPRSISVATAVCLWIRLDSCQGFISRSLGFWVPTEPSSRWLPLRESLRAPARYNHYYLPKEFHHQNWVHHQLTGLNPGEIVGSASPFCPAELSAESRGVLFRVRNRSDHTRSPASWGTRSVHPPKERKTWMKQVS